MTMGCHEGKIHNEESTSFVPSRRDDIFKLRAIG
jgi:hypothetical protein